MIAGDGVWHNGQAVVMTDGEASRAVTSVQNCTDAPVPGAYALHIVLVLAALGVLTLSLVVAALLRRRLAGAEPDLGWVSERWLAEYRADSTRPSL